ncbi:Hypothetical protein, putative [Bodo saltans]|uniref:Uncharacterized protein n=1 Tax=Bodo saltans TaxID=75058 RepID=A0A0S4JBL7_BODSA|nr:Hypothetical protein, putative [Bodo saltans]|eukprot:CUG88920.1 Hypothetical protein, putative [Bodo saltans]
MGASCCTLASSVEDGRSTGNASPVGNNKKQRTNKHSNSSTNTMEAASPGRRQRDVISQLARTLFDRHVHRNTIAVLLQGVGALPSCTPESWVRDMGTTLTESLFRFQSLMSSSLTSQSATQGVVAASGATGAGGGGYILVQELQYFIVFSNDPSLWVQSSSALGGMIRSQDDGPLRRSPSPPPPPHESFWSQPRNIVAICRRMRRRIPLPCWHGQKALSDAAAAEAATTAQVGEGNLAGYSVLTLPAFRNDAKAPNGSSVPSSYTFLSPPADAWNTVVYTSHAAALSDRQRLGANITACQEGVLVEGIVVRWNSTVDVVRGGGGGEGSAMFHDRQDWHWQNRLRDAPVADATRALLQRIAQLSR